MTLAPPSPHVVSLPWWRETWRSAGVAAAVALTGGLLVGGATPFMQGGLPHAVTSFANSAGGWTALAFLLVWLGRARPLLAALLGAVAFIAMVESYGAVSAWRGSFYSEPFTDTFTFVGLVAGPVLGVAASLTRWWPQRLRALPVSVLGAVLVGEGVYGLTLIASSTSPVYWSVQLAGGVVALAAAVMLTRPGGRIAASAIALTLAGATAFYGLYAFVL
jgi:hypothetical protein